MINDPPPFMCNMCVFPGLEINELCLSDANVSWINSHLYHKYSKITAPECFCQMLSRNACAEAFVGQAGCAPEHCERLVFCVYQLITLLRRPNRMSKCQEDTFQNQKVFSSFCLLKEELECWIAIMCARRGGDLEMCSDVGDMHYMCCGFIVCIWQQPPNACHSGGV